MFTGIIEEIGEILEILPVEKGLKMKVRTEKLGKDLSLKDSISVNGICLTCVEIDNNEIWLDVVEETVRKTNLSLLKSGDKVNLELPLKHNGRLDGHMVQGHVDGIGSIISKKDISSDSVEMTFEAPQSILSYIVEKGSIAIDGISLTAWNVQDTTFSVALIPYTMNNTTLGLKNVGDRVNLEVDLIAKYIEKITLNRVKNDM